MGKKNKTPAWSEILKPCHVSVNDLTEAQIEADRWKS
jgi:hypothetical protein